MAEFAEKYINPFTDYGVEKLFEIAEIARFTPDQIRSYEDSLKYYRDLKNSLNTAKEEGREEGREERNIEIAKELLKNGIDIDIIAKSTSLTREQIERLK
jgi:predicted transposase/invertase (TIGR01784 family)